MALDSREFRNALGRFATGVCVASTRVSGHPDIGVTINSFASVSLDPPLVLWSLNKASEITRVWEHATHYGISILSANQQDVSNTYAKPGDHAILPEHLCEGANGVPLINNTLVQFECRIVERIDGGDHIILLAEVENMSMADEVDPLLFFSGQYRAIAE